MTFKSIVSAHIIGFGATLKVGEGRIMRVKRAQGRTLRPRREGVEVGSPSHGVEKFKKVRLKLCIFGGRRLDADPLYINELDTINSLLHHKKHVRGSSDIGFVAFNFA